MLKPDIHLDEKLKQYFLSFSNIDKEVKKNNNNLKLHKNEKKNFNKKKGYVNKKNNENKNSKTNYQKENNIYSNYYSEKNKNNEIIKDIDNISIKETSNILTFSNNKNINLNKNNSTGSLYNIYHNNINKSEIKKNNSKKHFQTNFTFQPELNKNSIRINQKLENNGLTSQRRLLMKKEKISPHKSIYFSENIHSPYYLNMNLIRKDKNKNITPFIDLYERCRDKEMFKNEKIEKKKIELSNKENYSFHPQFFTKNKRINDLSLEKKNHTNETSKSTNNSSLINGNMTLNFKNNKQLFLNFLENNQKFINKQKRNLSKLIKNNSEKEMKGITFFPETNKKKIKDDFKNIIKQIPFINDYILKRRNFLEKKKREEELEEYNNSHHLSVSERKFINEEKRPKTPDCNVKNLKKIKLNDIIQTRKKLGIEHFYSNECNKRNINKDYNDKIFNYTFSNEDFKYAIWNIKKINNEYL